MATGGMRAEFRIGGVLGKGFSILFSNIVPFGILALLITAPTPIFTLLTGTQVMTVEGEVSENLTTGGLVTLLIEFALTFLLTAALTYGTFQELRGRRASLGDCIGRGLGLILPVVGASIVVVLIFAAGGMVIALIVGLGMAAIPFLGIIVLLIAFAVGVYVYIGFWLVIPVVVVERPPILASLGRSWELVKGYRWSIFAILFVVGIVQGIAGFIVGLLGTASSLGLPWLMISWAVSAFVYALYAVVATVGYHDLRAAKEGIGINEIAAVFD